MTVTFAVLGVPAPKGSKSIDPRSGRLIEGSSATGRAKYESWSTAVAWQARNTAGSNKPLDGPLFVVLSFRLAMPASRPKADRERGARWHTVKPDLDKLVRSTLDGMVAGGLIRDDSRVASIAATAIEVTSWTGAVVQIHDAIELDALRQARESDDACEVWGLLPDRGAA